MIASRTASLAVILFAIVGVGIVAASRWPSSEDALDCAPSEVRWVDGGSRLLATCAPGAPRGDVPAAQALTLGVKLDLNQMSEADLTLVPGIGASLARAIVAERKRLGRFRSWDEVDRVRGVGRAKVEVLQALTQIPP
ncbi:MAG TPA: helix-hairpin-helix domain-containing protein [Myxococcaceae bacterium]|nr:helix-hairpin-helix domain-containing protein [Myxococcaceae bacterium]